MKCSGSSTMSSISSMSSIVQMSSMSSIIQMSSMSSISGMSNSNSGGRCSTVVLMTLTVLGIYRIM